MSAAPRTSMIAVVISRGGEAPIGGLEAIAECAGNAVVVDIDVFHPASLARRLVGLVADHQVVVLPASPDGRDLAPRLAAEMGRPLLAGAVLVGPDTATVARRGGLTLERHVVDRPFVATLQPGVRGVPVGLELPDPVSLPPDPGASSEDGDRVAPDADVLEVSAPDASDLDLAEATRILSIGAGFTDPRHVELAAEVADALGMSLGATRVVTDRGWLPFERQIGTTGAMVDPEIYVALAISGAVQHVSGLGDPARIVSVNTDGSCPMAALADINIVCDAPSVLIALADRLDIEVAPELRRPSDTQGTTHG